MQENSIYIQMLKDASIPITKEEIEKEWQSIHEQEQELKIANDSMWSPFWRLITAIATTPAMWIVNLLIEYILPNFFLKTATGKWLRLFAWAVDVDVKGASKAKGVIQFTRESGEGELKIEKGLLISSSPINNRVYRLTTSEEKIIPDGTIMADVAVTAEKTGTEYNLGPGYYNLLPEPVKGIKEVKNASDWLKIAGCDEEDDESLRLRCKNQFSAVGQYHHDAAYRADISGFAGIKSDYIWFQKNAPRGPGSANAFIMIESGKPTQDFVDSINTYIRDKGNHGHGDDILCLPMPVTSHDLIVTAYYRRGLSEEKQNSLKSVVTDIVRCAFRENQDYKNIKKTMPFSRFSFSILGDSLHDTCLELESVKFNIPDISSQMSIPVLNSLVVNMEEA